MKVTNQAIQRSSSLNKQPSLGTAFGFEPFFVNMDPVSIIAGVSSLVKVCFWAGGAICDLSKSYNSANTVLASMARECETTCTILTNTQIVLRDNQEAFSRPGGSLELLKSFDGTVDDIGLVIRELAIALGEIGSKPVGDQTGSQIRLERRAVEGSLGQDENSKGNSNVLHE